MMSRRLRAETRPLTRPVVALLVVSVLLPGCSMLDSQGSEQTGPTSTLGIQSSADVDAGGTDGGAGDGAPGGDDAQPVELPSATAGLVVLAPISIMELTASGFKDSVEDCDVAEIDVVERNALGDVPGIGAITEGLLDGGADLIATVATPTAQAAYEVVKGRGGSTPVVYATVTDPFSAGLATDPATHDPWITGSASPPPIPAVIDAVQEIVPGASVLGVVRNPEEANSRFAVEFIIEIARQRGLRVETVDITDASEAGDAAESLLEQSIDVFVIPTDTTVFSGLPAIAEVADANDIPIIGTDPNQANNGAAIGLGSDYYGSGFRAGGIACRVLGGEATPADFDVVEIASLGVTINESAAEAQGAVIPERLRELAEFTE